MGRQSCQKPTLSIPETWLEGLVVPNRADEDYHWAVEYEIKGVRQKVLLPQAEAWNFDVEAKLKIWFELDENGCPHIKRRHRNNKKYVVI